MNELPFVFANRAARRRVDSRIELRSTLDADEIFHRGQLISVCEVDRALRRSMADNVWFAAGTLATRKGLRVPPVSQRQGETVMLPSAAAIVVKT